MRNLLQNLWDDEQGAVLSAEAVLLGTVGVLGATAGANMVADSVNGEMQDFAHAIRHLDQSYHYTGFVSPHACVAGSSFQQEDIEVSIRELGEIRRHEGTIDREHRQKVERKHRRDRDDDRKKKAPRKKMRDRDRDESSTEENGVI